MGKLRCSTGQSGGDRWDDLVHPLKRAALGARRRGGPLPRFGIEAVADAEMRMDVAPARRAPLELLAQLAHEDIDRPVAVSHRVAPDALVYRLALQHLPLGLDEQLQQLELAAGQVEALAGDEGLV